MQINRHHNFQKSPISHPLAKSKSPDNLRQKIPTFRPKTLQQIFEETKRKKSSDKNDKAPMNLKESGTLNKKTLPVKEEKVVKNSLAALIAESGHQDDIESIEYTNSELEDHYPDQDFDKFASLQSKQSKKYEVRVFTPQCVPFSKLGKDLFKCKDDASMYLEDQTEPSTHWNGEITLATSMCEDDFEKANEQESEVPKQYRGLIDERCFYVLSVNSQNQSEYLMESLLGFELEALVGKLIQLESGIINSDRVKKIGANQTIRFLSVAQMDEFLAPQQTHEHIEKYLKENLKQKKFISLIYFVEAGSLAK